MDLPKARITSQAAEAVRQGRLWIFAGQIKMWEGRPGPGDLVEVSGPGNVCLGYGYANPRTTLSIRLLYSASAGRRGPGGVPDERLEINRKLDRAWSSRQSLLKLSDAYRLVWSEADGLPGVVCDRYGRFLVVQFLTAGAQVRSQIIVDWLVAHLRPAGIFERSEGTGAKQEGLLPRRGWRWLPAGLAEPSGACLIQEGPLRFEVNFVAGQKTGFYLDQRAARRLVQGLSLSGEALDCFCYTGGFALSAALAGARRVTAVDSSNPALMSLARNLELNPDLRPRIESRRQNVFTFLRSAAGQGAAYELVILDPPAFIRSRGQREAGMSGYCELHRLAAKVAAPGGYLLSCACSHQVSRKDLVQSAVAGMRAAGRTLKLKKTFGPDADHPEKAQVPESRYLSCLLARIG